MKMSYGKEKKEVKDLEDWAAVQKVYKSTKSKRATTELLGISRNMVRKLLELSSPPTYQRTHVFVKVGSIQGTNLYMEM